MYRRCEGIRRAGAVLSWVKRNPERFPESASSTDLARISHQEPAGLEANARRQGCRGAIHRAHLPTYCTLGDVHKLLPRAVAAGPFASSTAGRGEKCGLQTWSAEELSLDVTGSDSNDAQELKSLKWIDQVLKVGDVIEIKILPPGQVDSPDTELLRSKPQQQEPGGS